MLDAERAARERAEATREQAELALSAAIAARDQALIQVDELAAALKQAQLEPLKVKEPAKPAIRVAKVKTAPRTKAPRVKEPKPVKWWLSKPADKSAKSAKTL